MESNRKGTYNALRSVFVFPARGNGLLVRYPFAVGYRTVDPVVAGSSPVVLDVWCCSCVAHTNSTGDLSFNKGDSSATNPYLSPPAVPIIGSTVRGFSFSGKEVRHD